MFELSVTSNASILRCAISDLTAVSLCKYSVRCNVRRLVYCDCLSSTDFGSDAIGLVGEKATQEREFIADLLRENKSSEDKGCP